MGDGSEVIEDIVCIGSAVERVVGEVGDGERL